MKASDSDQRVRGVNIEIGGIEVIPMNILGKMLRDFQFRFQ